MNRNSQVNNTSSGAPSFNYQDDVQMEGAYSLVNDDEVGEGLNNHVQRNWEENTKNGIKLTYYF